MDATRKNTKNLAQRSRIYQQIIQTQELLAHAVKTGDKKAEIDRLRRELATLAEKTE